jgi:hypothetical protein
VRLFGKRLGWGTKHWFACWLLVFALALLGEIINVPWLPFAFGALCIFVVMPILNILDGRNKNRGGNGIMWEKD